MKACRGHNGISSSRVMQASLHFETLKSSSASSNTECWVAYGNDMLTVPVRVNEELAGTGVSMSVVIRPASR